MSAGTLGAGSPAPRKGRGLLARLPGPLRPLEAEREGRGRRWRIETVLLLALALVIAVATVYDLTREVGVSNRLTADIETWRAVTGLHNEEVAVEQDLASYSTRDTACGDVAESTAKENASSRICIMLVGPVSGNRRRALGGFYLPPFLPLGPHDRYGCFGSTLAEGFCTYASPPGLPSAPPKGFRG